MRLLAIDPGPVESAFVEYDTDMALPIAWLKVNNYTVLSHVLRRSRDRSRTDLAIEMVASYGMAVGAEVFDTCVWIGRFTERWFVSKSEPRLVYRREVKLHLCGDSRAKDANIRQALIDRYGGKEQAVGRKATPGPLYGLSGDCWSALGVAITASETTP